MTGKADSGRYSRQVAFPGIGVRGQRRLGRASMVQVGCGGLGSTLALCLVRSGVKTYTVIDPDRAELHNLPRQFLFDETDVKKRARKALAAAGKLRRMDSGVEVRGVPERLDPGNADRLLRGHDLVLDGLDNLPTRYLVNDWCVKNRVPWIYGGVAGALGMTLVVLPGQGPCLRCLFPDPVLAHALPETQTTGIINTAPALLAALQATEAIKLIVRSPALIRDLRIVDLWSGETSRIALQRNPDCPCCGKREFKFLGG